MTIQPKDSLMNPGSGEEFMRSPLRHGAKQVAGPRISARVRTLVIFIAVLNSLAIPQSVIRAASFPQSAKRDNDQSSVPDNHAQNQTGEGTGQKTVGNEPVITLAELERMALQNNPTLAQAEAAIRAADGRRLQAGLYPDPVVGYSGEELAFRSFSNKSEHFFFVEQNIITGGKLRKSRRIFEQEMAQSQAESEAQRLKVLNTVRMLYYKTLGAQRMVEVRSELAKITREAVRVSEELFNIGQADQPDQLEIEIESQKAEVELITAENDLDQDWQLLAAVTGNPSLEPMRLAGNLENGLPTIDRNQMTTFLLQESPEIKIAKANVERAQAKLDRAKAERVPDLFVRGGIGYSTERLELGDTPFQRRTGPEATIEIGARLPLWNRNQGNIAAAEAELTVAEREVKRVELSLRARLAAAFTSYQNSARLAERYKQTILPRTEKSYKLYLASFNQMAAAYPQVLIAKRTMYQTQADYLSSLVTLWQNAIRIQGYLMTGGLDAPSVMRDGGIESATQDDEKDN